MDLGRCSQELEGIGDSQLVLRFGKLEEDVEAGVDDVAGEGNRDAIEVKSTNALLIPLNQRQLRRVKSWKMMVLYLSHLVSRLCIN